MPTTITNQARLQFTYGATTATASSNIASTSLQGPLSVSKSVLENAYRADGDLTYMITLSNTGAVPLTNIVITDDLGTYAVSETLSVTPLFYRGPTQLYINGVFSTNLTPAPGINSIAFTIPSLAAGANAMLIYKVDVDDYARLDVGASILNTAVVTATGMSEDVTVESAVPVDDYADISITKAMSPNPVTDGSTLTYTFTIQNYGNTAATNVILSDAFSPAPSPISVSVNGVPVPETDYTYAGGLLTLPSEGAAQSITVPAATFLQDAATGQVTVNPGTAVILVAGTI